MKSARKQRPSKTIEFQEPVSELQPLLQYLDLLKMSFRRYEHLKKSGVSEVTLSAEGGFIGRQIQFLSRACSKLMKECERL